MRILPIPFYAELSPRDVRLHECSDRITVPRALYNGYDKPDALLRISTACGESVGGVLHGAHDGDNELLFVPSWMFYHLKSPSSVVVASIPTVPCEHVQLRPPLGIANGLKRDGTLDAFQAALQCYKTLTQHTRILVGMDPPLSVEIEELYPASPTTLLVYNVGTVGLSMLGPKETDSPFLYKSPATSLRIPFVGQSNTLTLNVVGEDAETCRARMAEAARGRLAKVSRT
jgi:hypothetical protein